MRSLDIVMLMEMIDRKDKIVLYGAGDDAIRLGKMLLALGYDDFQVADSYKCGQEIFNRQILERDKISNDAYIIIASRKYIAEIYSLLIFEGFQYEKIFSGNLLLQVHYVFGMPPNKFQYYLDVLNKNKSVNVGSCYPDDVTLNYNDTKLIQTLGFSKARSNLKCYRGDYDGDLLASLLQVIKRKKGKLTILDFGGAFGVQYFKYREIFSTFFGEKLKLKYCIVDLPPFVELGNTDIKEIEFYNSLDDFFKKGGQPDCLLLSGVLQTLYPDYEEYVNSFIRTEFDYIIVHATNFLDTDADNYGFLYIPLESYRQRIQISPILNLSKQKFMNSFLQQYKMVYSYQGTANSFVYVEGKPEYQNGDSGYLLEKLR